MRIVLALGGGEDGRFLHLPALEGFAGWLRLVAPEERVWLHELRACSPRGELAHPGEVPVAGETTLAAIQVMVSEDLGPEAVVELLKLGLGGGAVLHAERGLGTRIEAPDDAFLAERAARATASDSERWRRIFAGLRFEARSDRRLELELEPLRVLVRDGRERIVIEA